MSFNKIIIPARSGSKGWPGKNVKLFDHTAKIIPVEYRKSVIVTTDDLKIAGMAMDYNFTVHERPSRLANDRADTKSVMQDVLNSYKIPSNATLIMLYLTYPSRSWDDISGMYNRFISSESESMLCAQPPKTHPCLMMFPGENNTGIQVVEHDMYQRQQYPECFELSHYMCMFKARELTNLNKNMYNKNTQFYNIPRVIDVDSEMDYNLFVDKQHKEHKMSEQKDIYEYKNSC